MVNRTILALAMSQLLCSIAYGQDWRTEDKPAYHATQSELSENEVAYADIRAQEEAVFHGTDHDFNAAAARLHDYARVYFSKIYKDCAEMLAVDVLLNAIQYNKLSSERRNHLFMLLGKAMNTAGIKVQTFEKRRQIILIVANILTKGESRQRITTAYEYLANYYKSLTDAVRPDKDLADKSMHRHVIQALRSRYPNGARESYETRAANQIIDLAKRVGLASDKDKFVRGLVRYENLYTANTPTEVPMDWKRPELIEYKATSGPVRLEDVRTYEWALFHDNEQGMSAAQALSDLAAQCFFVARPDGPHLFAADIAIYALEHHPQERIRNHILRQLAHALSQPIANVLVKEREKNLRAVLGRRLVNGSSDEAFLALKILAYYYINLHNQASSYHQKAGEQHQDTYQQLTAYLDLEGPNSIQANIAKGIIKKGVALQLMTPVDEFQPGTKKDCGSNFDNQTP